MSEELLKKFGRYFLLDRIAQGGMAEIYRARLANTEGAGRILVIKRIQSGFHGNSEFLQMFKSEIKVTMGFNHPNIVQLYDFGEEEGMPYIAMEFVDGKNARQFAVQFEKNKHRLPVELAAYVIEQAAAGLYYAHSYRDKITGQPLNVVHRDISPQNILVSYDGTVKIIDFGIAKATTNSEATQAGIIKGKPSYLAPEQITGAELDGRCDIFALGICLWELLVGRKLFAAPGENEYAVLKLIESCQTYVKPPSQFNPSVHKELDAIVLKSLQKRREDRYSNAEEFHKALKRFIFTHYPEFNPSDLSYWAKNLFKDEIVSDKKDLQRLNAKAEQLLQLELDDNGISLSRDDGKGPAVPRKEEKTFDTSELGVGAHPAEGSAKNTPSKLEIEDSEEATAVLKTPVAREIPSPHVLVPNATSRPRTHTGLKARPAVESKGSSGKMAAALFLFALGAGGYFMFKSDLEKVFSARTEIDPQVNAQPAQKTEVAVVEQKDAGKINLKINIMPNAEDSHVVLNEQPVNLNQLSALVSPDAPLELVVQKKGFRPFRREFVVQSSQLGELKEWVVDVSLEPLVFGYLTLRSVPSAEASVYQADASGRTVAMDKKPWAVLKTPIEEMKFPVGTYQIRLENKVLGMARITTVEIQEGKIITREEKLEILK